MRAHSLGTVVRRLRHVVTPPAPPTGTDADLVRAFAARRDPAAFEHIVRRHGPMVLGVCRRVLRESTDADDAFQATFVVLVRKARSLRQPERLAGWLHQVAHRTARKLRAARAARHGREGELFDVPAGESPAEFVWRELRPIFDEELNRLPDKLRLPAVLCFLEGHSKGEAARALGWPEGTLSGRLHRAREKLRRRFAARGLTLSAGALAVALFDGVGAAAVPAPLLSSTISLAAAGGTGVPVAMALADGVVQAMFVTKVKAVAVAVLLAGMIGAGTGVVLVPGSGPGELVAGQPKKDPPSKVPAPEGLETKQVNLQTTEIERGREKLVIANLQVKNATQSMQNETAKLRTLLQSRLDNLRTAAERETVAEQRQKLHVVIGETEAELKSLAVRSIEDRVRALLEEELKALKDRREFERQMVRKGFMTQEQIRKTELEIARVELQLTKKDAPKAPDPRQALFDEAIRKMEEIVSKTGDGVRRGIVPEQELLNAEVALINMKLKIAELSDRRPTAAAGAQPDSRRTLLDEHIRKLEEIVQKTEDGVKKGIVPEQELLNAQVTLINAKLKVAELGDGPATPPARPDPDRIKALKALLTLSEQELSRAEALLKSKAISQEEVRTLRIEVARRQADLAEATGDYAAAARHREAIVAGTEEGAKFSRELAKIGAASQGEIRAQEIAVAEARVEALKTGIRLQLAQIVAAREKDLADAKAMYQAKALSAEELRKVEKALAEARQRLAEGR
ncbi:MAG TPA: sigma-70 family RNA polymerase sigma factor [Gemmataceae bacterium]|nr:sigma-70 family RNA polymerase sigma factor [Gemmataceae bacterium]